MYVCIYIYYASMYIYIYYVSMYMYVYVRCMYICMYMYVCVRIYIYIYVYVLNVYIYMYIIYMCALQCRAYSALVIPRFHTRVGCDRLEHFPVSDTQGR